MEDELSLSPQDLRNGEDLSESEHEHPQKRQKLAKTEQWPLSTTTKQDAFARPATIYAPSTDV
jgi:hypothetical protein